MERPSENWLKAQDDRLSNLKVPIRRRPWSAWAEWGKEMGSTTFGGPVTDAIFEWWKAHYGSREFSMGGMYVGAHYFDARVWAIDVPVMYGQVQLDIFGMLRNVPEIVMARMGGDSAAMEMYMALAADSVDYALGFDDLRKSGTASPFADAMLASADKELRSAVDLLISPKPDQKVSETAALATEMFLKFYLAHHTGLNDQGAKGLSHRIDRALECCLEHDPSSALAQLRGKFVVFPPISARYAKEERSLDALWYAYRVAQTVATAVVRSTTDRDVRSSMRVS